MLEIKDMTINLPGFSVENISLTVNQADFFALLGPTGSGKSVILEGVTGLIPLTSGTIRIAGKIISSLPPEARRLGLVYQDHALFPHMTVRENILYGIRYHPIPKETSNSRFDMLVQRLKLGSILHRNPTTLSGGEKQRTALARSLMLEPQALLLDEPLSALDQVFRDDIRQLLKTLHTELAIPFVLVSHSFSEVQFLANKGAVINHGRFQQSGTIEDLFQRPNSTFVASFVGMKNIFPCQVSGGNVWVDGIPVRTGGNHSPEDTHLALRPEEIDVVADGRSQYENNLPGVVTEMDCQGFYFRVGIRVQDTVFQAYWTRQRVAEYDLRPGKDTRIGFPAQAVHTFHEPEKLAT